MLYINIVYLFCLCMIFQCIHMPNLFTCSPIVGFVGCFQVFCFFFNVLLETKMLTMFKRFSRL